MKIPVHVYTYRVTASELPKMPPGHTLIDKGNRLVAVWEFIDLDGRTRAVTGEREKRVCSECYAQHRVGRDYGHAGPHGRDAPWTPL